ncbi:hypothetical protein CHLRE_01g024150v5 [Chlamydomonas reinhardtii]|uniref:Uncharacterized protein n=1 Tax=Chlamydomonas reinhardtii TaxID=3055 RepID=A8HQ14_CHLRE|nr:uncharacterized protein CHLRE_01g024150v5 [Chlamydomonas reinhardtii]PNW88319.1 hypothetical protein CHLRE_01g024150v5 [Chlamydomonas reinhardtii]|eukprot:XP_001689536.1 predicted protein [Chlamydomonas reinhardtii]
MDCSALAARRALSQCAGPSSRCLVPAALPQSRPRTCSRSTGHAAGHRATTIVARANGKTVTPSPLFDEVAESEGFIRLVSPDSAEPNFDDPDWISKVDDWHEFWNYNNWELEVEDIETEEGNIAGPMEAVRRAEKLVDAFAEMDMRTDIVNWMGTQWSEDTFEEDKYANPPMDPERPDPNPPLTLWDLRARAEKARQRQLIDAEWHRRQNRIGKLWYPHMDEYRDMRVRDNPVEGYRHDWTEEQIQLLITNNGIACDPKTHGALTENPLANQDYHALGVRYLEETEELLERTGHLASTNLRTQFDREFILHGEDYGEDEAEAELDAMRREAEREALIEAGIDPDEEDPDSEVVGEVRLG